MNRRSTRFRGLQLLVLLLSSHLQAQDATREGAATIEINAPEASYLGQRPPGDKPERFAPRILAANPFLGRLAFSPDGRECFFTVGDASYSTMRLFVTRYGNGAWSPQVRAPFTAEFEKSGEPFFSPDGNRLYFTAKVKDDRAGMDIWMVDRSPQGWGTPTRLPAPVNSDANEFCFSMVPDGTMYFVSERTGTAYQLYRARLKPDQSVQVEPIPAPILSVGTYEGDPCVGPDGRFLVFGSGRAGGFGAMDLQISLPDGKGEWKRPVNLGADFNTASDEYGPTLSPDGKYLFFVRHSPQKGEIYWVSTRALEDLRPASADSAKAPAAAGPPTRVYVIQGKPSAVVQDHEAMLALALQLENDLKADLGKAESQDGSTLQRIHVGLYGIAMLKKDHAEARRHLELVRGLQGNPAARLLTGLITGPYMDAAEKPGADFHATFRALLSRRLAALPYVEVQGTLRAMKDNMVQASKAQLVGSIEAGLDPAVKDGRLGQEMAVGLVSTAMNLEVVIPVKDDVVASLEALFEANKTAAAGSEVNAPQMALGAVKNPIHGAWFGRAVPGETPVLFAPEILNEMSVWIETIAFSPDGTECFIDLGNADYSSVKTYYSTRVHDAWTPFAEPSFLTEFVLSAEVVFSPDGKTLTFIGMKPKGSKNLWTSRRTDQGWSVPVALPPEINNGDRVARGSTTSDGTLYFGRSPAGLHNQIFRAYRDASQKLVVEKLGAPVNVQSFDGDPCIAPDGRFLVFYSGRIGGQGGTDLYVSFPDGRGGWKTPINLGTGFNSPGDEYGAHLSTDGKYLFFTRHDSKGNNIYWVSTSAIDRLKT
jgi:Tol biopolymer transport system component